MEQQITSVFSVFQLCAKMGNEKKKDNYRRKGEEKCGEPKGEI